MQISFGPRQAGMKSLMAGPLRASAAVGQKESQIRFEDGFRDSDDPRVDWV